MRSTLILAALFATAWAAPRPQGIDFDAVEIPDDVPTGPADGVAKEVVKVAKVDIAAIKADIAEDPASPSDKRRRSAKRAACVAEPFTGGPQYDPTNVETWKSQVNAAYPALNPSTLGAYTKVFDGYTGSINQIGYLGLTTITSYDVDACKTLCDKKEGCLGFNLYVERDPVVDPGDACRNPDAITNYKCTLWGYHFQIGAADNIGETRRDFKIVIAASVAYLKPYVPTTIPGYVVKGQSLYGAINAPSLDGKNTYMGYKLYPSEKVKTDYFNPLLCQAASVAQSAYNSRHHDGCEYQQVNFFNAYTLLKDGKAQGIYCSLYSNVWDDSYAVNGGQVRSDGKWDVVSSFTFANSNSASPAYVNTCKA